METALMRNARFRCWAKSSRPGWEQHQPQVRAQVIRAVGALAVGAAAHIGHRS